MKIKVVGTRTIRLVEPRPCGSCNRPAGERDRAWGVEEEIRGEHDYGSGSITRSFTNVLVQNVTLFEAQAVYAGAMQKPPPELEIDVPDGR